MNNCKVISIVLVRVVPRNLRSRRDWVRYLYLPFFKLCFIRRCYDKEEFDTDCSNGCLKRFNRIVQETCSVLTYDNSLSIRNCFMFFMCWLSEKTTIWENANTNLSLLLCKHSIKMSTVCVISKQLAFLSFHLMIISLRIQQISKQFHITSALSFQFSSGSKKTRALHFNTSRVRKRSLGTGGLKHFKRDTTVWFVRCSEGTSSATLLNIAFIAMENTAESDYNRPICGDLFEFLSLKCHARPN